MTEAQVHNFLVWETIALSGVIFLFLLVRAAPYGRHYGGSGWGPHVSASVGWFIMELPATAFFWIVYVRGSQAGELVPILFLIVWQAHYVHRTFIYPLRTSNSGRRMPLIVVGPGFLFNMVNAYINARFISEFGHFDIAWLGDIRFQMGIGVFLAGMILNLHSDGILLRLRQSSQSGYEIPTGGAFRFVSCPNYLGEILEWAGWALATWSLSGLSFFLFTAANLIPRARSNHRWYHNTFDAYPPQRKALIPWVF